LAGLSGLASGCGRAEPQFPPRAEVKELIPPAQDYLHELMEQNFGTPTEMVLWERFPLHYHAARGKVAEQTAESGTSVKVSLDEQTLPIQTGMEVTFLSGKVLDAVRERDRAHEPLAPFHVVSYDEATHELLLSQDLPVKPAAGDQLAIGPGEVLLQGRLLYAEHCLHCHGVGGDGDGPTAKYLNPRPRDYRIGRFKFTSTIGTLRAQRGDLARIVENGIPGTYMPSFKLLTAEESTAIVEYVLWLSVRGETELMRWQALNDSFRQSTMDEGRESDPTGAKLLNKFRTEWETHFAEDFEADTNQIRDSWEMAQRPDSVLSPKVSRTATSAESIARGRALFMDNKTKCFSCHGTAGRGDGYQTRDFQKDPVTTELRSVPGLFDEWGNLIKPRDLTTGIYRGGRRPVDIFRRISAGIKGTPMTGFATALTDEEIWDIVNYVMSIPFEERELGEGPYVPATAPTEGVAVANPRAANDE
jgi:mono/diheme cytochrome c family protein